jgi:chromatin remodeling complex protein RSC6
LIVKKSGGDEDAELKPHKKERKKRDRAEVPVVGHANAEEAEAKKKSRKEAKNQKKHIPTGRVEISFQI